MGVIVVKKLLSFLLTAALVLSFLPLGLLDMTASAATSGTTGECTWSLDGTVLTISGNGVTRGYFDSVGPWGSGITEVIIENGVTGIGPYAFSHCSDLAKIVIPDSVVRIGYGAFNGTAYYNEPSNWEDGILYIGKHLICTKQSLSGDVTVKKGTLTIASRAFYMCYKIESINFPDSLVSIDSGDTFSGCKADIHISSVERWCSINFCRLDSNPFYASNSSDVRNIPYLYIDGKKTTDVIIPDGIKEIGANTFAGYYSLERVTIPEGVIKIGDNAFSGYNVVRTVKIPNSVTTLGKQAFAFCEIKSLTIGDNVTSIKNDAFLSCKITDLYISEGSKTINPTLTEICKHNLEKVYIPKSVTAISENTFSDCGKLTDVYYEGSSDEWNRVTISSQNDALKNSKLHCNSDVVMPEDKRFIKCASPKDHNFGDWLVTVYETCTEQGVAERICKKCGEIETKVTDALGHDFESFTVVKEATISETGLKEGKCRNCGQMVSAVIPCTAKDPNTGIEVSADDGTFNKDAELKTEEIAKDSPELDSAKKILKDICKEFTMYSISATLNGSGVQPNGKVKVKFAVPDGYGSNISVNVINADGTYRTVDSILSEDGSFITAELDTLGSIAICKLGTSAGNDGSSDSSTNQPAGTSSQPDSKVKSGSHTWLIVLIVIVVVAAAGVGIFFVMKKKKA